MYWLGGGKSLVILFSGYAGIGKTTCANMLYKNFVNDLGRGSVVFSKFASGVKACAYAYFNWNGQKDDRGRKLLQDIGQMGRDYNKDNWIRYMLWSIDNTRAGIPASVIIVDDWRYPNEAEYFEKRKDYYDIIKIRVSSTRDLPYSPQTYNHPSETSLTELDKYDYFILNDKDLVDLEKTMNGIYKAISIDLESVSYA